MQTEDSNRTGQIDALADPSLCWTQNPILWLCHSMAQYKPRHEKTGFCICENKDADQLGGDREADQRLCFRYIASTIPLLPKYKISSL